MARNDEIAVIDYVSGNMHSDVCILRNYIAPFDRENKPMAVVVYSKRTDVFLRFKESPVWDCYGEDYGTIEAAIDALRNAGPPRPAHISFSFPLNKPAPPETGK